MSFRNIGPNKTKRNYEAALLTFSFGLLYMFFSVLFEHGSEERLVFAVLGVILVGLGLYIMSYEPFK